MQCAQLGLEPNTAMDHAYLIPREDKKRSDRESKRQRRPITWLECTLQIGYKGYLHLAANAGVLVRAHVVHDGDTFDYGFGDSPFIRHQVSKDPKRSSRPVTHVYAVAASAHFDGEKPFVVLDDAEVMDRKALNPNAKRASSPWNTPTGKKRMYEKTAVRALIAWVPQSPEPLQRAAALDEASEGARSLESCVDTSVVEALQGHGMEFPQSEGDDEDSDEGAVIETTGESASGTPALPACTNDVGTATLEEAVRGDRATAQLRLNDDNKN
jgi:recombination protein RecT